MALEDKWKAISLGGVIIGLGPFIPFLNLSCCLVPIAGAIVAVAIQRNGGVELTNTDGIVLGVMTAVFGTAVYAVLIVPITLFLGGTIGSLAGRLIPQIADIPAAARPLLDWFFRHLETIIGLALIFKVMTHLALNLVFATLGGLLGVAIFKRRSTPA